MKTITLCLILTCLSAVAWAGETWFDVGPDYAKPFRSEGFSARQADGLGAGVGLENLLTPVWAAGVAFEDLKIDQQAKNPAYADFVTASLRWMPADWAGARPYVMLQLGALTQVHSDVPLENRGAGLDSQAGLGVLLTTEEGWSLDLGLDASTAGSGSGLNLIQAHAGIVVCLGS